MGVADRERGFLSLLSEPLFDRISRDSVTMRYEDGQQIHAHGEKKPGISFIRKGGARLGSISGNGGFVEFGLLRSGDVFGEMTIITGIARIHDCYAVGPTVIDHLAAHRFRALVEEFPELQNHIMKLMARRLQHAYQRIDDILRLPLVDRVGRHLLAAKRRTPDGGSIVMKQSDLAEAMAASRVSISKAMSQLSTLGLVSTGYGRITLVDSNALTKWLDHRHPMPKS